MLYTETGMKQIKVYYVNLIKFISKCNIFFEKFHYRFKSVKLKSVNFASIMKVSSVQLSHLYTYKACKKKKK